MSAIPCIVSFLLAAQIPAIEFVRLVAVSTNADYQRRLDRAVDEAVEVAGTAVGDGSRRAGGDQVAHKRAVQSNILYLRSPTRVFADHRKSALLPLPLSHRRLFRFLFRCAAPPFLPPARKKSVFPTIRRRRKLSVTNVTRLDFIFVMSDIPNANRSPFSAGLPNWHSAGTARRSRRSATQMLERPNM
jgi:hypothetical protein